MEECQCAKLIGNGLDIETPRNEKLSAFYKRSFAHHTVKNRMPIIITQCMDGLVRNKEEIGQKYGRDGIQELKVIIGELSKLKYEIQTNKSINELVSDSPDVKFYNDYLKKVLDTTSNCTYFNTVWLHAECYMYRKVRNIFEQTELLHDYDPFKKQKDNALELSLPLLISLGTNLMQMLNAEPDRRNNEEDFKMLLKLNLWGNKCDLSLSNGEVSDCNSDLLATVDELNSYILSDASTTIWDVVRTESRFQVIDIILDNSGYEIFTDFCLADFLITKEYVSFVRFHVKTMPWFVSDVTTNDFTWMLGRLKNDDNVILKELGERWTTYLDCNIFKIEESHFWTLPVEFTAMSTIDESLYRRLGQNKLIIFKGDLNYRKLFGEKNWDPVTPVVDALQGFYPNKLCTIRTLKSDIICGLQSGVAEKTESVDKDWLLTGNYGVIQYSDKIRRIL